MYICACTQVANLHESNYLESRKIINEVRAILLSPKESVEIMNEMEINDPIAQSDSGN